MSDAVIFDVDGTLIDSVDLHTDAWDKAFRDFGFTFPRQRIRQGIGKGGNEFLSDFLTAEQSDEMRDSLKKHREEIGGRDFLPRATAFPQVRELLQRIKQDGQKISLGSSASSSEAEWHKRILQCDDLIDERTSGDHAAKGKPEPDIFLAALEKLHGIPTDRVIVVGDSPWDMIAARRANLRAIGMLSGGFLEAELREAGAIEVYHDPADLLRRYESSALNG